MKNVGAALLTAILGTATVAGCGGSGGTCSNSAACGGDVVGTWIVTSSCLTATATATMGSCAGLTVTISSYVLNGSITYGADLTYNQNLSVSLTESLNVPTACLTSGTVTGTCDGLGQQVKMSAGYKSGGCSAVNGGCSCVIALAAAAAEAGTYTITGSGLLTTTPTTGDVSSFDYCAKGAELTLSPHADTPAMGNVMTAGSFVLAKQ